MAHGRAPCVWRPLGVAAKPLGALGTTCSRLRERQDTHPLSKIPDYTLLGLSELALWNLSSSLPTSLPSSSKRIDIRVSDQPGTKSQD